MNTYIFKNIQLPGLDIKVEAEHEQEAYQILNRKFDEHNDWLRFEVTELWEVTASW